MKHFLSARWTKWLMRLAALAMTLVVAGVAAAATARVDESQLLDVGFKVLVATTKVQQEWVRGLPAGKIRPVQRTGKKFFIYPAAAKNQIYVGGPKEYEAFVRLHPEHQIPDAQKAAKEASAYRLKQSEAMRAATARDASDPFLGASWADLGW